MRPSRYDTWRSKELKVELVQGQWRIRIRWVGGELSGYLQHLLLEPQTTCLHKDRHTKTTTARSHGCSHLTSTKLQNLIRMLFTHTYNLALQLHKYNNQGYRKPNASVQRQYTPPTRTLNTTPMHPRMRPHFYSHSRNLSFTGAHYPPSS